MSEYAAGQADQSESIPHEKLEAPHMSGTPSLFEHVDEVVDTAYSVGGELGPVATIDDISDPLAPRYPESVLERQQALEAAKAKRRMASLAMYEDERSTPYAELGGLRAEREPADSPLEQVLLTYEPWMHDIRIAVEDYGLFDLNLDDLKRMTSTDRDILALYVDGFMDGLKTYTRLVSDYADTEEEHEFVTTKYNPRGLRSKQELSDYRKTIITLVGGLRERGVVGELQKAALHRRSSPYRRHLARKNDKATNGGVTPRIYFDQDKPRIKERP